MSILNLSGKKALVTGGARGIGRACAQALAQEGADVAIVDLNDTVGAITVETLRTLGSDAFFVEADVSDTESIQAAVQAVTTRFGRLDIAINNAGILSSGAADEVQDKADWDKVISINLTGVRNSAQAQAQQMIQQQPAGGKIINIASIAGVTVCSDGTYGTAKAGVIHLTKILAQRWARYNINVNSIAPGFTMTPMLAALPEKERQQLRNKIPLGHLQRPEDIGNAALFLASDAANYITGHNLVADGGYVLNGTPSALTRRTEEVPPRLTPAEESSSLREELALEPGR